MITRRLALSYDECEEGKNFLGLLEEFYSDPSSKDVEYLVIGPWEETWENSSKFIVDNLVENKDKLPSIKGLFIGDMESEDCEISWIIQSDLSPLLRAFPNLEELKIRGSSGLRLSDLQHDKLKTLIIECGGLSTDVIDDILESKLPNLEHLELYLGVEEYGFNGTIEDIKPFMKKGLFPKLKYLGLKDSEIQDEIAHEIANSDILDGLDTLDLSMGTLTDEGAESLLKSNRIKNLKFLDLNYHYMSDDMMKKIKSLGIKVDVTDQQEEEEYDDEIYRYPAVTE
ncbi:MAG TPA: STM4015 family protein [Pseudobacteroides sp.]|uniref:STM4015 family protein n=1 Tax=Pseudobacteroides sp. TaxID=1968840 RepID=UPI002F93CB81